MNAEHLRLCAGPESAVLRTAGFAEVLVDSDDDRFRARR